MYLNEYFVVDCDCKRLNDLLGDCCYMLLKDFTVVCCKHQIWMRNLQRSVWFMICIFISSRHLSCVCVLSYWCLGNVCRKHDIFSWWKWFWVNKNERTRDVLVLTVCWTQCIITTYMQSFYYSPTQPKNTWANQHQRKCFNFISSTSNLSQNSFPTS